MAERPKAAVLKTAERKLRGFESLPLRHTVSLIFLYPIPMPNYRYF